jgi:DNA-binding CsgD family transcriptional regulator
MAYAALTDLVGRDEELRRLEGFLNKAAHVPTTIVLVGEAGIGKTTLWRAGVERASARGFRVLEARPTEAERELSFAALGDLLADVRDEIGGLPAPQRRALRVALLLEEPPGVPPNERAVATAVSSLLASLAANGLVVVAVDDVQWLDESTRSALRFALRRAPVAVLLARRADANGAELGDAEVLVVPPLGLEELDDLLRGHLSASFLRPTLLEIERVSGGNPFFALELARALVALPKPPRPSEPLPVPDDLRGLVTARLDRLAPPARTTALLAAAAVRPTRSLLERSGGDSVDELIAAGVIVHDGDTIRFAHPLLAATAYSSSSSGERAAAHKRLAAAAADPEERGHHLAAAAEAPDAEVAAAIDAASAHARARGAADAAGRLAARAVELTPPDDSSALHRRRLTEANAWVAAGLLERARSVLDVSLQRTSGRQRCEVLYAIADIAANVEGRPDDALEKAEAGLAELVAEDVDLRAQFELVRSSALRQVQRYEEAEAACIAAVEAAEVAGDRSLLSRALSARFYVAFELGHAADEALALRAIELSEEQSLSEQQQYTGHLWAHHHYANFLSLTYRTAAAREIFLRLRERARVLGDADEAYYLMLLGWNEFWGCSYDDAARYAEEAVRLSGQTGRSSTAFGALYLIAFVQAFRGELDEAGKTAEEMQRNAESHDPTLASGPSADVLGLIAFARGDFAEAAENFEASESYFAMRDPALRPHLPSRVEALVAMGRLDEAKLLLDPYEQLARTLDRPVSSACALRGRALLCAAAGDHAAAQAAFEEALTQHGRLEVPFEHARTLLAYGSLLRRRRQRERARLLLAEASAIFGQLGCSGWAERAQTELLQLGGRPAQTGRLTPTETRIAALVGRGRSNAEVASELFMSPKTVEWNLSKIYRKLGVRSRGELAAKLRNAAG